MTSTKSLVEHCIIVDGAPKTLNKSQLLELIQRHESTTNILKHHFQEVKQVNQWVLWLNLSKSVNYLCDEVQEYQINIDDENHTVTFLRCNESDIPKAWLNSEVASSNREFGNHHQHGTFLGLNTSQYTSEKELHVQQFQKPTAKAKLSNLPKATDNDFLELYLEQELGNEVAIESIELCGNGTEAIIEFQRKEMYDALMQKQPLDMEGQNIFVELIESQPLLQGDPKTIEVTSDKGIITENTARTIRLYFGNHGRSDGGKIVEFKFVADTETILIAFESAEVAKAVSARKDHRYKDALLNVVLVDEDLLQKRANEDCEKRKRKSIRITNVPYEIDKDTLEMVFEDAETFGENICVTDVKLDTKSSSAIIQFEEADDVERILQKKQVDIEGQTVHIEPIEDGNLEEPCTVVVAGPTDLLTEDNIKSFKMYFNNKRRSGGEDVIGCCVRKPGSVEVTFKSSKGKNEFSKIYKFICKDVRCKEEYTG